jgi:TonB family protein
LPTERLSDFVPDWWKFVLRQDEQRPAPLSTSGKLPMPDSDVARVGGDVRAPRGRSLPDPKYQEIARLMRYQGTVILWMVVNRDGLPRDINIVRPLGLGLDERAVEAVQKWRFDPATKDGQPIPAQVNIEVNFRLYYS